jgi:hypothetical protein
METQESKILIKTRTNSRGTVTQIKLTDISNFEAGYVKSVQKILYNYILFVSLQNLTSSQIQGDPPICKPVDQFKSNIGVPQRPVRVVI